MYARGENEAKCEHLRASALKTRGNLERRKSSAGLCVGSTPTCHRRPPTRQKRTTPKMQTSAIGKTRVKCEVVPPDVGIVFLQALPQAWRRGLRGNGEQELGEYEGRMHTLAE